MFSAIIDHIVNKWEETGITSNDDHDIYVYGLDLFLFTVINALVLIVTSVLCGKLLETVVLLCVVVPMQAFGGGYHAETHLRCFLIMFIGWWIVMPIINMIVSGLAMIISVISLITIYVCAPVPHVNVPMSEKRKIKMRKISQILGLCFTIIIFIFLYIYTPHSNVGILLSAGLGIIAISMFCAWIKSCVAGKQEHISDC